MTQALLQSKSLASGDEEVLISVQGVSKKFCRSLKRSLWYGLQDIGSELMGRASTEGLRPDEFWAVNDVSFELRRGECLGLIGPNGAGKSTLLKMLNGLIKPDRGRIEMRGRVGALIELGAGFNPILTGRENIYVNGSVLGLTKREIDEKFEQIVAFAEIGDFLDTPVQNYSSGMRVRLGFAVAAHLEPDILLIDEVLAVGDVGFRMKCFEHLLQLINQGVSLVFVSHALHEIYRVTNRAIVLNHGRQDFDGDLSVATGHYQNLVIRASSIKQISEGKIPQVKEIILKNKDEQKTTKFATGESILLYVTIKSNKMIESARLVVFVESPILGILGSFSTAYSGLFFKISPPETTVKIKIYNIPLLIGGYFISCDLYGNEISSFYDRVNPGVSFQVTSPDVDAFGFGLFHTFKFDHNWEVIC